MPEPMDTTPETVDTTPETVIGTTGVDARPSDPLLDTVASELLAPVDDRTLASLIGFSVLAVNGVARLEPTLKNLFQAKLPRSSPADRPDGVAVTSTGAITDVTVDLGTASRHQSREVAESVQREICQLLEAHGREVGRIRVNVLTIEQSPSSAG